MAGGETGKVYICGELNLKSFIVTCFVDKMLLTLRTSLYDPEGVK